MPSDISPPKLAPSAAADHPELSFRWLNCRIKRAKLKNKPMRSAIWIGILIGSTIGGLIPSLWGGELLSYSGLLLSGAGAFAGLWVGYKMST